MLRPSKPSTLLVLHKLLAFDPTTNRWQIKADFGMARGYCGVSKLNNEIWILAGESRDKNGEKYYTKKVQIYNPKNQSLRWGPELAIAIPSALALNSSKRLYLIGFPDGDPQPLKIFSIGKNEQNWTAEPDGPLGFGASYGVELNGKLYSVVGHKYLAIFDTKTKQWQTSVAPHSPRSPAVAKYKGEIWLMGGRTKEGGDACYIYSPQTKAWRKGPSLPRHIVWGTAFNLKGKLYLTGGCDQRTYRNETYLLKE